MRWIYLAVIILFAAATFVFALQNFEIVTMSFSASMPACRSRCWSPSPTCWARRRAAACSHCCADPMRGREASLALPEDGGSTARSPRGFASGDFPIRWHML